MSASEIEKAKLQAIIDRQRAEREVSLLQAEIQGHKNYENYVRCCIKANEKPLNYDEYTAQTYTVNENLRALNDPCAWFYNDAGLREKARIRAQTDEGKKALHWGEVA